MRLPIIRISVIAAATMLNTSLEAKSQLGFNLDNATIPVNEIHRGGPLPDGIPSIDQPRFTAAADVDFLQDDDILIGFSHNGLHRAYPFRILIWHEIINDVVGEKPIAVVYCPLCGTAMVFDRRYRDQALSFGVSGLLYNSDVLMFDRQTRSLWSQLGMAAVSGEFAGTELKWLPSEQLTWEAWKERYPEGEVLNANTGHNRDYKNLPYGGYLKSLSTMFPYSGTREEFPPKTWVTGVIINGQAKAYPLAEFPEDHWIEDQISGHSLRIRYNSSESRFSIEDSEGKSLPSVQAYWFAWQAFYPKTQIWKSSSE